MNTQRATNKNVPPANFFETDFSSLFKAYDLQKATVFEQNFTQYWSKVHFYGGESLHYQINLL